MRSPRNASCACGSGKKFKHCCGAVPPTVEVTDKRMLVATAMGKADQYLKEERYHLARDWYRKVITLDPTSGPAFNNEGIALESLGLRDEALASFTRAVECSIGTSTAVSAAQNLSTCIKNYQAYLFSLLRADCIDETRIAESHRRFGRHIEAATANLWRPHQNVPDPDRRLRIGYVSPDFRTHSVAHFIEPVIVGHRRDDVEVFCYHSAAARDGVTKRFEAAADHWLNCCAMPPTLLAQRIRDDNIDILVDLAGHTLGNCALTFALRPAPVQIGYLGYPTSVGLSAIEYRVSDDYADPAVTVTGASERLLVVRPNMLVYQPISRTDGHMEGTTLSAPTAPCLANGYVTFGCLNDPSKFSTQLLEAWTRILRAVPESKLVLKAWGWNEGDRSAEILARFSAMGLGADRLTLRGREPDSAAHLRRYHDIDVALDTFPYNGVTTTFECIWMGVPVITLAGASTAGRMGVSIVSNLGHAEWVAATSLEYVEKAVALAANPVRIAALRLGLRETLRRSPLMDINSFVQRLESAYRGAWRSWCDARSGSSNRTALAVQQSAAE